MSRNWNEIELQRSGRIIKDPNRRDELRHSSEPKRHTFEYDPTPVPTKDVRNLPKDPGDDNEK